MIPTKKTVVVAPCSPADKVLKLHIVQGERARLEDNRVLQTIEVPVDDNTSFE